MKRKGTFWIWLGILLVLAALSLACYNMWDEARADKLRMDLLNQIQQKTVDTGEFKDIYKQYPEQEMPTIQVEDYHYLGVLEIPALGLELPVIEDWSYKKLKTAPCRYSGSVYQNDLIISAHNYDCHFGNLKSLTIGDAVAFTDMDGNFFSYEVVELEILQGTEVEAMKSGDWDLTLFTCTYSGQDRVTIRCKLLEDA